jgi:hypothetical protein
MFVKTGDAEFVKVVTEQNELQTDEDRSKILANALEKAKNYISANKNIQES